MNINDTVIPRKIESIINIMDVTSLQTDQIQVLKHKIEAAKQKMMNLSDDESAKLLSTIKDKETLCQQQFDQKLIMCGEKKEIPTNSSFTGKVIITFNDQKMA